MDWQHWPQSEDSSVRHSCWKECSEWDLDQEKLWEYTDSSTYQLPAYMAASIRAPWFHYSGIIRFLYPEPPNSGGRVYRSATTQRLWPSVLVKWDRFVKGLTSRQRTAIARWLKYMSVRDGERWNDYAAHGTHLNLILANYWGQFLDHAEETSDDGTLRE